MFLSEFDYIEENLATHKLAYAAWNQVFRHSETDIRMRSGVQSARLSELQAYRDQHLVQADRVLLCVTGGIDPEVLKETMEKQLGVINLTEKTLPASNSHSRDGERSKRYLGYQRNPLYGNLRGTAL